jgi:tetratricopeptide (TPR) repeat protein
MMAARMLVLLFLFCSYGFPAAQAQEFSREKADTYARAKKWSALLKYTTAWTQASPADANAWSYLGISYGSRAHHIGLGRTADARRAYQKSVALDPSIPEAWNALAFSSMELNQYADAVNAFTHAAQLRPNNANYWNSLGSAYAALGNKAAAKQNYLKASSLGYKGARSEMALVSPRRVVSSGRGYGRRYQSSGNSMQAFYAHQYDSYLKGQNPVTGAPIR